MQLKIRKFISSLLLMSMALLFTPVDLLHLLVEEHHEDLHLCHSDFCVREFEGHCDLCDHTPPIYYSWKEDNRSSLTCYFRPYSADYVVFEYNHHHLLPLNKAPPVS